jgi:excisionase family DNA binding protein
MKAAERAVAEGLRSSVPAETSPCNRRRHSGPGAALDSTVDHGGQCADQLLTVADVAGRIGAHEQTVRSGIKHGELKAARFGTRIGYRIKCTDYEDFLSRRTLTGAITAHFLKAASTAPDS